MLRLIGSRACPGVHTFDSPLVRPGGIIGFHDIIPDFKTRYGRETPSDVGEVPRFWEEVKKEFTDIEEFIEDPEQDGFGIGIIKNHAQP